MQKSEPVARIMNMLVFNGTKMVPPELQNGKFQPIAVNTSQGGQSYVAPAVVIRGSGALASVSVAHENQLLCIGDFVRTGPDTLMTIEFLIGGRAGVNRGTIVEISSERSVSDGANGFWRLLGKNIGIHLKGRKRPLEIQTNGGTTIKG